MEDRARVVVKGGAEGDGGRGKEGGSGWWGIVEGGGRIGGGSLGMVDGLLLVENERGVFTGMVAVPEEVGREDGRVVGWEGFGGGERREEK